MIAYCSVCNLTELEIGQTHFGKWDMKHFCFYFSQIPSVAATFFDQFTRATYFYIYSILCSTG